MNEVKKILATCVDVFEKNLKNIKSNTSSRAAFIKRFYRWLNPLKFLKLVHYLRDEKYGRDEVDIATSRLINSLKLDSPNQRLDMLELLRELDQ